MKHSKSLTKMHLTKKLSFSSTFLEVHLLLKTSQPRPSSVEEIVSEFSEQPAEVFTNGDARRNEVDEAIKTLNR